MLTEPDDREMTARRRQAGLAVGQAAAYAGRAQAAASAIARSVNVPMLGFGSATPFDERFPIQSSSLCRVFTCRRDPTEGAAVRLKA